MEQVCSVEGKLKGNYREKREFIEKIVARKRDGGPYVFFCDSDRVQCGDHCPYHEVGWERIYIGNN